LNIVDSKRHITLVLATISQMMQEPSNDEVTA
jgi:hypothetical protein